MVATSNRDVAKALVVIYGAVATGFGMRSASSLVLLDMTRDTSMGVSPADVGQMNSLGQLAYALGKLFGGAGVDRLGGHRSLVAVLATVAAALMSMARTRRKSWSLSGAFAISRFATAVVWSAAVVCIRGCCPGSSHALNLGQASIRLGSSLGSFAGGLVLARLRSWRRLLEIAALFSSAMAATLAASSLTRAKGPSLRAQSLAEIASSSSPLPEAVQPSAVCARPMPVLSALRIAVSEPKLYCLFASTMFVTPTADLVALLPQVLNDEYGMDDQTIGAICASFPLAAPPAILLSGFALSRMSSRAKAGFAMAVQSAAITGYMILARKPPQWLLSPALMAISAGIVPSLCCIPPSWLTTWAGPHVGLFSGLQDIPGNMLAMLIYSQIPLVVKKRGWKAVLQLYALQVGLGACCMAAFQLLEASRPMEGSPFLMLETSGGGHAKSLFEG